MLLNIENIISQEVITSLPLVMRGVLPEFALLCLATMVLLIDSFMPRKALFDEHGVEQVNNIKNYRLTFWLSNIVLVIILLLLWCQSQYDFGVIYKDTAAGSLVNNMVTNDGLSYILKYSMVVFVFLSFYFSDSYLSYKKMFSGEFYAMGLFSLLGMMVLVSSQNMLTMYLGLELFSLPVYAMVAMHRQSSKAGEAALKYFVMGAIASGVLLFGISLVYGLTGSLEFAEIAKFKYLDSSPLILSVVFVCVGIAFKFGAAPFHMWMPDVYEGAPTPATLFIATAPKLAAFGMAVRLLSETFGGLGNSWGIALLGIGLLSIVWGNVAALAQTNLKRLLAYSGISHMGFIILGLVAASTSSGDIAQAALASGLFYAITYSLMSLAVFGFIITLGNGKYELDNIDDFKGLYVKSPWLAFLLMLLLFSMAGVPPFVGFFAKMGIIKSLVAAGFVKPAIFAVLFTVVGAFYYLRMVWLMFFEKPVSSTLELELTDHMLDNALVLVNSNNKLITSLACLSVLALGIYSQWLIAWCLAVF